MQKRTGFWRFPLKSFYSKARVEKILSDGSSVIEEKGRKLQVALALRKFNNASYLNVDKDWKIQVKIMNSLEASGPNTFLYVKRENDRIITDAKTVFLTDEESVLLSEILGKLKEEQFSKLVEYIRRKIPVYTEEMFNKLKQERKSLGNSFGVYAHDEESEKMTLYFRRFVEKDGKKFPKDFIVKIENGGRNQVLHFGIRDFSDGKQYHFSTRDPKTIASIAMLFEWAVLLKMIDQRTLSVVNLLNKQFEQKLAEIMNVLDKISEAVGVKKVEAEKVVKSKEVEKLPLEEEIIIEESPLIEEPVAEEEIVEEILEEVGEDQKEEDIFSGVDLEEDLVATGHNKNFQEKRGVSNFRKKIEKKAQKVVNDFTM